MKQAQWLRACFTMLRVGNDLLAVFVSFVLGYILKFKLNYYPRAQIEPYFQIMLYVLLLYLIAFVALNLYQRKQGLLGYMNEAFLIFLGIVLATVEIYVFSLFYPAFPSSRYVVAYGSFFTFVFIFLGRSLINLLEDNLLSKGVGSLRTLVIGTSAMAQTIGEKFILYPALGFYLKGFVGARVPRQLEYHVKNRFVLLGPVAQLKNILKKYSIQVVILAEHLNESILKNILDVCRQQRVPFYTVAQFYGLISTQIQIKDLDGIPLIGIKPLVIRGWKRAVKRVFDLLVAGGLLILFSPIFLLTALAVRLTSRGPIFYTQTRVSKNGKNFEFIKFRSMRVDAESKTGPVHTLASKKKPLTPIGGFLRRSSIDELPQLLNVIKGDMSLVGPRPERPYFVTEYESKIKNYALRHAVRGGITGWAQINGRAVLTASPEEKLKYDLYYIENWSLFFDIKIILRTVLDVLLQRNAV
jgi:exopolysaccharide biosynthesis polyprenyl glycosylphosphotransferase